MRRWTTLAGPACLTLASPLLSGQAPPPTPGDRAGCATSTYVVDKLVCENAALRASDAGVRHLATSNTDRIAPDTRFLEADEGWLLRRNRCAFQADQLACLNGAYAEREAVAKALDWPQVSNRARAAQCRPDARVKWIVADRASVAAYDDSGRLVVLALKASGPAWSSHTSFETAGAGVRFRTKDGGSMSCEIVTRAP